MSNGGQASIGQARKLTAVKIPNSRGIDWAAPELQSVHFLSARRYASAILAVIACPSVRHKPALYQNG